MCYSLECHDVYWGKRQVQLVFDSNLQNDEFFGNVDRNCCKGWCYELLWYFGILKTPNLRWVVTAESLAFCCWV